MRGVSLFTAKLVAFVISMKSSAFLALITICAPFVAHAQDAAPDSLPLAPKAAATADAFVWRFAPPVGSRWTMRSFKRTTSVTQMPATNGKKSQQIKFIMTYKMTADYDVLSRDALGATTIRLTLREMTNDLRMIIDGKVTQSPMPEASGAATVLIVKQAPDGKVWGAIEMHPHQNQASEFGALLDAATINYILDEAPKDGYSPKSVGPTAGRLPVSIIRLGESWSYKVDSPASLGLTLDVTGTRTLKSLNSTIAVVSNSAQINSSNAPKDDRWPDADNMTFDYNQLTGEINGFTRVQRSSGLPLETTNSLTLSGGVTTKISPERGGETQTWTAPTSLATTTRIVLEPR